MPKVRSLSRRNCYRSSGNLLHVSNSNDLKSLHAVIPEHDEQQQEQQQEERYHPCHEEQLHYCVSSSSSSLEQQQQRTFKNQRKISIEDNFDLPPASPSPTQQHDDVTSVFLTSEYASQTRPQHHEQKPTPLPTQRASLSKLSRSGCLSSLVHEPPLDNDGDATERHRSPYPTTAAVNSISQENLSDHPVHHPTAGDDASCFPSYGYDVGIDGEGDASPSTGWGQFVDVIPLERPREGREGGRSCPSRAEVRFSPYGSGARYNSRVCSVRGSIRGLGDGGVLRHSASTDGISSALYNVRLSGAK